jgi:hypothetical protein
LAKTQFAVVWKYCEQQWFQNITKKVLRIVVVLLSHQTEDTESTGSPNNGQHEFLDLDLLLHLVRHIILRYSPFRRMMKFQSESAPVPNHKSLKFIFREP